MRAFRHTPSTFPHPWLTVEGARSLAEFFRMNSAGCSNFSCSPFLPTTPPLRSHYQQPGELHHAEALVGCQVRTDTDPQVEEKMAVRGLIQAAKEVRKEYFPSSGAPYYTYVNNEGSAILQNMQAMRREIASMGTEGEERLKKAEARAGEAVDRARLSDDRARQAVERARQAVDRARLSDDSSREAVARARVADDREREVAESSQRL